ncbi:DUF6188 family protein [Mycobacterium sp. LTG2003]
MGQESGVSGIEWVNQQLSQHFVGRSLAQMRVGSGIHLELGDAYEISIEAPLSVDRSDEQWEGEPLNVDAAGAVTPLLHSRLTSANVSADGGLRLEFGDAAIEVPPDDSGASWRLHGPDNLQIVCAPGGGVAMLPAADGS